MIAVVVVFGIAWMADTMFDAHVAELKASRGRAGISARFPAVPTSWNRRKSPIFRPFPA
jgi:C4-dicarboxylate anaerobic transporter